jgi:hypothetical protein
VTVWAGVLYGLTALTALGWAVVLGRPPRRRWLRPALRITLVLADLWLGTLAFDAAYGPQKWLVVPVVIVNAVLLLGLVQYFTGATLHKDVTGRYGGLSSMSREETMRANGWDPRRR